MSHLSWTDWISSYQHVLNNIRSEGGPDMSSSVLVSDLCLHRCGSRTDEPNSGSRSGPLRSCSPPWVWCRATGLCWEACTCSRPAWLDSTTPSPWPTSPASPLCCPLGRLPATRARAASAPVPVLPHSMLLSASMMIGTAPWGATSPPPCSLWPPCSPWTPPLTGAKMEPGKRVVYFKIKYL